MTPFVQETLALLHAQRGDIPPGHAEDPKGEVIYDPRCQQCCREITAQPPPTATPKAVTR
jgi:hypothetical protein